MKPADVKANTYIDSSKEINDKNPKFKSGDHVKISKCKNVFAKGYTLNWSEDVFVIKKLQTLCCRHVLLMILMGEEIAGTFYENKLQKINQKNLELKK